MADVAEKAAVSMMTVSRVINNKPDISEKTRQHVLQVMREIGYRPNRIARSLATDKSFRVGIVIPGISSAFFAEILEGAERILWNHDYNIMLCNTGRSPKRERDILQLLEEDRVDGVIVCSSYLPSERLSALLERQRAAVTFSSQVDSSVAGAVTIDELAAVSLAVNHLMASGRRRLGYMGFSNATNASRQRLHGFNAAVEAAGLPVNRAYQAACLPNDWEGGYEVAGKLLSRFPEIDGLVCFNDYVAVGTLRACAEIGRRVPDDIAVIGYDDIVLASVVSPTLTTVRYTIDKQQVGEVLANMLLERINGQTQNTPLVLQHRLVIRESAP